MKRWRDTIAGIVLGLAIAAATAYATDTVYWTLDGTWSPPHFSATTAQVNGGLLLAGACNSGTATVTGATTSMTAVASPVVDPGVGMDWRAFVSSADTVTVRMCAIVGFTATATTFNVKVLR